MAKGTGKVRVARLTDIAALAELSRRAAMPRVAVALTGRDEPEVIERCLAAGCRATLLKPVPARELLARAKEWLTRAPACRGRCKLTESLSH